MNIYFDGSLRAGVVRTCVLVDDGSMPMVENWGSVELTTSGHAEWLAAREAVFATEKCQRARIYLKGDCENIFRHLDPRPDFTASVRVSRNAQLVTEIRASITSLEQQGRHIMWQHVRRGENLAGIHLDRLAKTRGAVTRTTSSKTAGRSDSR